jgi:hypothetical protein
VRNTGRCSIDGCEKPSFAKNLCAHHYDKAQHPLNHTWRLLRSRYPGQYPPGWDRFDVFLAEVGERPGSVHQLRRINADLPYGASNVRWVEPVGKNKSSLSVQEQRDYGREWNLQRRFKITGEDYAAMLAAQGGVCAICGGAETHTYASGKVKDLAVDHCHATNTNRGLLCFNCNQGLGRFQDDPTRLRAAADYLDRHAAPGSDGLASFEEAAIVTAVAWASLAPPKPIGDGVALRAALHPKGPGLGRKRLGGYETVTIEIDDKFVRGPALDEGESP